MSIMRLKPWAVDTTLRKFGGTCITTFWYWTNFTPKRAVNFNDYEIVNNRALNPPAPGYWEFQTNLTMEDINKMSPKEMNRFMFQIHDIYRKGKELE